MQAQSFLPLKKKPAAAPPIIVVPAPPAAAALPTSTTGGIGVTTSTPVTLSTPINVDTPVSQKNTQISSGLTSPEATGGGQHPAAALVSLLLQALGGLAGRR